MKERTLLVTPSIADQRCHHGADGSRGQTLERSFKDEGGVRENNQPIGFSGEMVEEDSGQKETG